MQTIIINANCICLERQGIMVQAYVQWIIDDFSKAYRKLDFGDPLEPMGVVNIQLREQAEATLKDTIATMSIDEILSDKQPIIEELTRRLRLVAEGEEGLGLRIVTVQLKEAVISSARVWEMLQKPFRAQRAREARLIELEHQGEVLKREKAAEQVAARLEIEKEAAIAARRREREGQEFTEVQKERERRALLEAETAARSEEQQRKILELETLLERQRLEGKLSLERLRAEARLKGERQQLELERLRRELENQISPNLIQLKLMEQLPAIAAALPKAEHLHSLRLDGGDGLSDLLQRLAGIFKAQESPEP